MQRDIISSLEEWGTSTRHKPLILKGARQVGRTWALRKFGAKSFDNVAYVSLENIAPGVPSECAQLFERTHDSRRIMRNLGLALGCDIEPGRTLLVLDEIQDCPASLRYYARKYPSETPLKLRLSLRNLTLDDDTLNVPLYLAGHAIRLAKGLARGESATTALS